jgi:hypothetical protein
MQFPDNECTRLTQLAMAALSRADVLKSDQPNYPDHYNRAFTAIYEAFCLDFAGQQRAAPVFDAPPPQHEPGKIVGLAAFLNNSTGAPPRSGGLVSRIAERMVRRGEHGGED